MGTAEGQARGLVGFLVSLGREAHFVPASTSHEGALGSLHYRITEGDDTGTMSAEGGLDVLSSGHSDICLTVAIGGTENVRTDGDRSD